MIRVAALVTLAGTALLLTACAQPTVSDDWNRPFKETTVKPVMMHDMAIANPPHPQPNYVDYEDEPSRFVFHPRNVPVDTTNDDQGDQGVDDGSGDMSGGYVDNGILYVDPNQ